MIDKSDRNSHTYLCDLLDVVGLSFIVSSARIGDTDVIPVRVYKSIEYNYMNLEELIVSFPTDGLVMIRFISGVPAFIVQVPDDHLLLSPEAYLEYMQRAGYTITKNDL